jgi:lysophospholipase L1-like esterase
MRGERAAAHRSPGLADPATASAARDQPRSSSLLSDTGPQSATRRLAAAPQAKVGDMRYVAIGDSLARGWWLGIPRPWRRDALGARFLGVPLAWFDHPKQGFPAQAGRLLAQRHGACTVDISCTASGAATGMVWAAGPTSALETMMARGTPDLVTVCLGANDLLTAMGRRSHQHESFDWVFVLWRIGVSRRYLLDAGFSDTLRDAGLADVRADIEALARWLAARTPHLAIMTYPVADGSDVLRDLIIGPLNQMLREVAGDLGCGLIDLESLFTSHHRRVRPLRARWIAQLDGGHPNRRGQRAIARAILAERG